MAPGEGAGRWRRAIANTTSITAPERLFVPSRRRAVPPSIAAIHEFNAFAAGQFFIHPIALTQSVYPIDIRPYLCSYFVRVSDSTLFRRRPLRRDDRCPLHRHRHWPRRRHVRSTSHRHLGSPDPHPHPFRRHPRQAHQAPRAPTHRATPASRTPTHPNPPVQILPPAHRLRLAHPPHPRRLTLRGGIAASGGRPANGSPAASQPRHGPLAPSALPHAGRPAAPGTARPTPQTRRTIGTRTTRTRTTGTGTTGARTPGTRTVVAARAPPRTGVPPGPASSRSDTAPRIAQARLFCYVIDS